MPLGEDLPTEQVNPVYTDLDARSTSEILALMNDADRIVAEAVGRETKTIAQAVELIVSRLQTGGRLIYFGAGTSGRLGVLDAAECPPTFNTSRELVQAMIAGGQRAMFEAVEQAEDDSSQAERDFRDLHLTSADAVVGLTASGRTPYVIGGIQYARSIGAATVSISCNPGAEVSTYSEVAIEVQTGPEILTGSTRLKAGTAEKMVLNMISTATMIRLGKVYGNLMVDLRATNHKLVERAKGIHMLVTGVSYEEAAQALIDAGGQLKTAILMTQGQLDVDSAQKLLDESGSVLRTALAKIAGWKSRDL